MRRVREAAARVALVLFGLAVGLVALEVALQVAARVVVPGAERRAASGWLTQRARVVAIGDSNTYGLYVRADQAYPKVFERLWNRARPGRPVEVLNLGFPGMNSSRVRNAFPRIVDTFRPDVVTIMLGTNDLWTAPEPVSDAAEQPGLRDRLWRWSRVYRLFFILARSAHPARLTLEDEQIAPESGHGVARYGDTTFDLGYERTTPGVAYPPGNLGGNLRALCDYARRAGARTVFVTYADPHAFVYTGPSGVMRDVAATCGAVVAEVGAHLADRCKDGVCPELFPDAHPTVLGHRFAAKRLFHAVARHERALFP